MIDLKAIAKKAHLIAMQRHLKGCFADPQNDFEMLKQCAGEVVEAMDACKNYESELEKSFDSASEKDIAECEKLRNAYGLELADVIMCCLIIAHSNKIEIESALLQCLEKNASRV